MASMFASSIATWFRRQPSGPDPEQMQLVTAQLAQAVAIELVLKMFVAAQLVSSVNDPKDQKQIDALAAEFRDNILSRVEQKMGGFPDKAVAAFMEPIVRQTVARIYDGAAEQVRQTTALHFGVMPSASHN